MKAISALKSLYFFRKGLPFNIDLHVFFFLFLFQNADERRGMLHRLSHFFSSKRKKSSSKRHSDSDTSIPSPPLSPCSLKSEEEEELSTPTPSRKECGISVPHVAHTIADPENFDTLSQSSGHSSSSTISIVTRTEDSTNITPTTLDLTIATTLDLNRKEGFPESRVQDKCQQGNVDQSSSEVKIVNQTAPSEAKVRLSEVIATPAVQRSPCSNASAAKNTVNTGEKQDKVNQREAVLPSSALGLNQQVNEKCENAGAKMLTRTSERGLSQSCEKEHIPLCPSILHKAIWVETYLGVEDKDREEGGNLKSRTKECQEDLQADMPIVLAIPVTVISEDSDTQGSPDSPSHTLSSMECLQPPGSSQDSHTPLSQTNGSTTHNKSKPNTLEEKHISGEVCVTRKTVNLPSKQKVVPQKVLGNQVQSLALEKPTKEESRELPSQMSKATKRL